MGIINRNQGRGTSVTSGGSVYRSLEATVYGLVSQEEAEDTSDLSPVLIDKDLKLWAQASADPGEALPEGGTTGQVLAKASDEDYDVEWVDASEEVHGIPSGGSTGQVLAKSSGTDYAAGWESPHYVPAGGTTGQVLVKSSNSDYATSWADQSGGSEKPIKAISFSSFNSGTMVVTYEDDTSASLTVSFDNNGNPSNITDGQKYISFTW